MGRPIGVGSSYDVFTKDYIISEIASAINTVANSNDICSDIRKSLYEFSKNELNEQFVWHDPGNNYWHLTDKVYEYGLDKNFITSHDMALSDDWSVRCLCASLGYEHELLAKDKSKTVRSHVLHNTNNPYILSKLWESAPPLKNDYSYAKFDDDKDIVIGDCDMFDMAPSHHDYCYAESGSKEELMVYGYYGIDAGIKSGNPKLISSLADRLLNLRDNEKNCKYQTFQEFFEAHPKMCVLSENERDFFNDLDDYKNFEKTEMFVDNCCGIDAGIKSGSLKLISNLCDKLLAFRDSNNNCKYRTFQEFFDAHPEMCVLPENKKNISSNFNKSKDKNKENNRNTSSPKVDKSKISNTLKPQKNSSILKNCKEVR